VKEKEKEINNYKENIKELEEALEIMKNIISSKSVSVTVKAFIDSYEQEKDLSTTYLRLTEKIDKIERKIQKTKDKIKQVSESSHNQELEKQEVLIKLDRDLKNIQKETTKLLTTKENYEKIFEKISPQVLSLIRSLESLGLQPQCFQIIEDPSLNSTNITSHLNKLEELIEILLAGLLLKNNNNLSFKEEKHDNKLEINTINIEDLPVEEAAYPMTLEEIRNQAKNFLNSLNQ
jgi:hypothetical protein